MENLECRPGWDETAAHKMIELCRSGQASLHTSGRGDLWPAAAKPSAAHTMSDVFDLFQAGFAVLFRMADEGQLDDVVFGYRLARHDGEGTGAVQVDDEGAVRRRAILRCRKSFKAGCRWILPRLGQLRSAGWSLRDLFGVDTCTPPWGRWGAAWLLSWTRATEVVLENDGTICFQFNEPNRVVEQRSRPQGRNK